MQAGIYCLTVFSSFVQARIKISLFEHNCLKALLTVITGDVNKSHTSSTAMLLTRCYDVLQHKAHDAHGTCADILRLRLRLKGADAGICART